MKQPGHSTPKHKHRPHLQVFQLLLLDTFFAQVPLIQELLRNGGQVLARDRAGEGARGQMVTDLQPFLELEGPLWPSIELVSMIVWHVGLGEKNWDLILETLPLMILQWSLIAALVALVRLPLLVPVLTWTKMVVSINKGTPILTPRYHNPYAYRDPQKRRDPTFPETPKCKARASWTSTIDVQDAAPNFQYSFRTWPPIPQ